MRRKEVTLIRCRSPVLRVCCKFRIVGERRNFCFTEMQCPISRTFIVSLKFFDTTSYLCSIRQPKKFQHQRYDNHVVTPPSGTSRTPFVIVGLFLRRANGVRPYIMPLYFSACVACYMTAHVYRYRQACNVGRGLFDVYGKTGLRAAKALRSYA